MTFSRWVVDENNPAGVTHLPTVNPFSSALGEKMEMAMWVGTTLDNDHS